MRGSVRGWGLAVSLLAGSSAGAVAQTGQFVGVDTLRVFVTGLSGELPAGLTTDAVRGEIESVLAGVGIGTDTADATTAPALRVGFSIVQLPGGWVIGVRVELVEVSVSLREYVWEVSRRTEDPARGDATPDSVLGAVMRNFTTWSRFAIATCGTEEGYDTAVAVLRQLVVELGGTVMLDNPDG